MTSNPFLKSAMRLSAVAALSVLSLSACGPLISFGDGEPETVYSLTYGGAGLPSVDGPLLFVSEPTFAQGLGGRGFSAKLSDFERTSIKNVRWSTGASTLMRDYLVVSLRDKAKAHTLGEDGLDVESKCRLNSYVWDMDFVPGASEAEDSIYLRLEFSLINLVSGDLIGSQMYEATRSVNSSGDSIAAGFNSAMDDITTDLGNWMASGVIEACRED